MAMRPLGASGAARCPLRTVLLLLLILVSPGVAAVPGARDPLEEMGRWERNPRRCRLEQRSPSETAQPPRRQPLAPTSCGGSWPRVAAS
jgi:hypothetical protein